ncbi:MAG: hypothetical protein CME70_18170 [Halobacteriovorax sp.]|nr:hypothetical protein [Halobacteriovorax sp.]|tara:strand:+ start:128 stop:412 length:285 start_codon:yes stop_codon:yes gene_type:complete
MAFSFDTLSRIGQTAGKSGVTDVNFTLYIYATADAKNAVDAVDYFNDAAGFLNPGDVILAKASDGIGFMQVVSNDGTTVDTGDMDQLITATDSR